MMFIRTFFIALAIGFGFNLAFAQTASEVALEPVRVNVHDQASVLRGAQFFAKNCMVCHTMKYLEYNSIAEQAGITLDKMPLKQKEWWLNVVPPDLTLIARQHSPAWLYTYFHSFYKDSSRPTGYNNLVKPDVNMMNIFAAYQGEQVLLPKEEAMKNISQLASSHYYSVLALVKAGSMTPAEFDATTTDLVNFLVYAADPTKIEREKLGVWVLLFLALFIILAYFLKKSFWDDVD
jgi:ubiquinol-cytochrome c reductase cytochrome c1 subunit